MFAFVLLIFSTPFQADTSSIPVTVHNSSPEHTPINDINDGNDSGYETD